LPDKFRKFL